MEKYGEIPKRFTKAWWEYFWYYYKWHTIGLIFTLCVVIFMIADCASRPVHDFSVTYAGDMMFVDKTRMKVAQTFSEMIEDVDGNGKTDVNFKNFTIAKANTKQAATEYNSAMMTKLMLEFQTGDTYIFLLNREQIDRLFNRNTDEELFVPVSDWATADISELKTAKFKGTDCAVNITNSKFFSEQLGLNMGDSLYIAVRNMRPRDEENEIEQKRYSESVKLANYILNNT